MKRTTLLILLIFTTIGLFGCVETTDPPIDDPNYSPIDDPHDPQDDEPVEMGTFDRLFDVVKYRKITIEISSEAWYEMDENMQYHNDQFGNLKTDEYVVANMIYEDDEGVLDINHIGIRPRGNLSLTTLMDQDDNINMNHFKIKFNEDFDGDYPDNDGRRGFDLKELNVKWNRNYDDTYLTEPYAFRMMNAFGVYAPMTTHFVFSLKIDDVETVMGLYIGFEPIDDEFIERRYDKNANDGDLYKCLWQAYGPATLEPIVNMAAIGIRNVSSNYFPAYDLKTNKDTSNHEGLLSFIDQINALSGSAFNAYIEANFEVDMFLRLLAVNAFFGNPDDYRAMGNNYYLYQNSDTGKWSMIPYDFDHGLGQGWFESQVYPNYTIGVDIYAWFDLNDHLTGHESSEVLVDKLFTQSIYREQYKAIVQDILNDDFFTIGYFNDMYQTLRTAFEGTYDDALDTQAFGLRHVFSYIFAKRDDISSQITS